MDVLTECILSDHWAMAVSIQCSHLPEFDDEVMDPSQVELTGLRLWLRKERITTMKAKTYLINCNYPQTSGIVKTLIVQMRNICKK